MCPRQCLTYSPKYVSICGNAYELLHERSCEAVQSIVRPYAPAHPRAPGGGRPLRRRPRAPAWCHSLRGFPASTGATGGRDGERRQAGLLGALRHQPRTSRCGSRRASGLARQALLGFPGRLSAGRVSEAGPAQVSYPYRRRQHPWAQRPRSVRRARTRRPALRSRSGSATGKTPGIPAGRVPAPGRGSSTGAGRSGHRLRRPANSDHTQQLPDRRGGFRRTATPRGCDSGGASA